MPYLESRSCSARSIRTDRSLPTMPAQPSRQARAKTVATFEVITVQDRARTDAPDSKHADASDPPRDRPAGLGVDQHPPNSVCCLREHDHLQPRLRRPSQPSTPLHRILAASIRYPGTAGHACARAATATPHSDRCRPVPIGADPACLLEVGCWGKEGKFRCCWTQGGP